MRIKRFLKHFISTFSPHKYKHHVEKQTKQTFELYFSVIFIAIIISFLIFVPILKMQSENVASVVDNFDTLNITIDVETNSPVTLIKHPKVIVDTNATMRKNAKVLINDDKIFYRKNFIFEDSFDRISSIDLTTHKDKLSNWFYVVALILLPAYILGVGIIVLILTLLLSLISTMIAVLIIKKNKITVRDAFISAIHATIPGIFIFLVLLPFYNVWWISLILFVVIYVLALFMMKGYKFKSVENKPENINQDEIL